MSLPGIQVDVENKRKDTEQDYKHDIVHRSYSNSEESTSISESMSNPQPDMTNTTIQDQTQQHQQHQHQKNRKDDDHEDQQEDHEDDHPTCAICLGPYRGRVYLSPCFHVFCASCLSAWIEINLQCPLCKSNPVSLHYGVDTALEVIHTLQVSDHNRGELITVLNEVAKDVEKRNEKSMDEDKEEQRDRDRDHQHGRKRSYDNKEEDDDDDDDYRHYDRSGSRSRSSSHERNQVYKLGLEPYPPQDFSMVDQILESDMVLLDPFLERDLAVLLLMDYRNQKISPVILAHCNFDDQNSTSIVVVPGAHIYK
ncbi:hypothetical protein BGZ83_001258 [Gryganskiella cystojenkinii]|nr:hypothetical protein BGZ83_001258 [Gryganskiella cystojenkinii]